MATQKMVIRGMQQPVDGEKVGHALRQVWGIQEVALNFHAGEVTVKYDENAASPQDFQQAIIDCGFETAE